MPFLRRYRILAVLLAALLPLLAAAPALAAACSGMGEMASCCHSEESPAMPEHCPSDTPAGDEPEHHAQTCCAAAPALPVETAATLAPDVPRTEVPTCVASPLAVPPAPFVAHHSLMPMRPPSLRPHLTNAVLLI